MEPKDHKPSYLAVQARLVEIELDEIDAFLKHVDQHRDEAEARQREWARTCPTTVSSVIRPRSYA